MSAEIVSVRDGVLTMEVRGTLSYPELASIQTAAAEILRTEGKLRVLVLAEQFAGWGDVTFQAENDARIERMAIIGDRKWEELALLFTAKGLREFPIEYFAPSDAAAARAWLAES